MPLPVDEHSGFLAGIGVAITTALVVFVRWLFSTRRELRTDHAEVTAASTYERLLKQQQDTIDRHATRIKELEGLLDAERRINGELTREIGRRLQ